MKVVEKIKADIKEKGLKMYAVADKAGIPRAAFYKTMAQEKKLDIETLVVICKALGEKPSKYIED